MATHDWLPPIFSFFLPTRGINDLLPLSRILNQTTNDLSLCGPLLSPVLISTQFSRARWELSGKFGVTPRHGETFRIRRTSLLSERGRRRQMAPFLTRCFGQSCFDSRRILVISRLKLALEFNRNISMVMEAPKIVRTRYFFWKSSQEFVTRGEIQPCMSWSVLSWIRWCIHHLIHRRGGVCDGRRNQFRHSSRT